MVKRFWSICFIILILWSAGCQQTTSNVRQDLVELYKKGRYEEAIPIGQSNLAAAKKEFGPASPEAAANMNLLGLMYYSLGDFTEAEPLFLNALQIRESSLSPDSPEIATSLNNLALLYDSMGDYSRAESYYRRALSIREKILGKDHPDIAASLNNLAGLYYALGDYSKAVPLYNRAIKIWEKSLGPDHPDVAVSLSNLAGIYMAMGDYRQAESLYKRSLAIREAALGKSHPDVAAGLNNLALLYHEQGRYDEAAPRYEQAVAILEGGLGRSHPDAAAAMNNYALLRAARGEYGEAEKLFKRSISISESRLGPEHPDVASGLDNLAGILAAQGKYKEAHELFKRAQVIDARLIDQVMGFTSEEEKVRFLATKQSSLEGSISLVVQFLSGDPEARKDAFNVWIRRKGVILDAQKQFQMALVRSDNDEAVKVFQKLNGVRAGLSRLTFAGPGEGSSSEYRGKIIELEKRKNELEAELSRMSQSYALQKKAENADVDAVAQALPRGTVLVDYARIHSINFLAKNKKSQWGEARYIAFVVKSSEKGDPVLVDLGSADRIDQSVQEFKRAVTNLRDKEGLKSAIAGAEIYQRVFQPLIPYLGGADYIFISPDGKLNLIPFETLSKDSGGFLIEDYTFNYLSSGRDLIGFGERRGGRRAPILMGDPDFDLSADKKNQVLAELGLPAARNSSALRSSSDMRGLQFGRLPGTRKEIELIKEIVSDAKVYAGAEALEDVLVQMHGPRILHLATHGFFLSDDLFQVLVLNENEETSRYFNPLIRSGLALAGANDSLRRGSGSDGILTAEKVLGLDLKGSELVVLSACETGLGEVKSGEGVYGLRRAFNQAGAESMIMSMWSVPDKETQELMVNLYNNLKSGDDRCKALRQAAMEQMKTVETRYGHRNPFFWGAFIFFGQPD